MESRRGGRGGGRGGRHHREDDPDVKISKNLSWLLRHGAEKEGLTMNSAGFVPLAEILQKNFYKTQNIDFDKIKHIVDTNEKKRFELKSETEADGKLVYYIRASQGHTLKTVNDEELLTKIDDAKNLPMVLHGTYREAWELIKKDGLKPMSRNHVHFASGYPGEDGVISGMRKTCNVFIELDAEKVLADGIEVFISSNGVILSRGKDGSILPKYFKKVLIRDKGGVLKEVEQKEYLI